MDREYSITEDRFLEGEELMQFREREKQIRAADPYRACRQDIFKAMRAYDQQTRIAALENTLRDERATGRIEGAQ